MNHYEDHFLDEGFDTNFPGQAVSKTPSPIEASSRRYIPLSLSEFPSEMTKKLTTVGIYHLHQGNKNFAHKSKKHSMKTRNIRRSLVMSFSSLFENTKV